MVGFWNPIADALANSCGGLPAIGSPSIVERRRVSAPPIDAGREPRGDEAERRLARLVRPDEPDDLAVGERQVDVVEDGLRVAGVAVRDARQLEHRRSGQARERAGQPADDRRDEEQEEQPADDALPTRCRASPRAGGARPGRLNARASSARLRSSTSVSDDRMTGPTSGRTPRSRARTLPSVSRPRARWLSAITAARSTRAGTASIVATRDEREPRREAAPLEVEDEGPRIGGQDEQPDRGRDREQPDERLGREVDALDGRVERADREEDGRAGPGEDADEDDRDRDRQGQQERDPDEPAARRRHAAPAGRMRPMIAIGPT